jgi:beta-lactamase regulating signal transducer with metallopeptidase domain
MREFILGYLLNAAWEAPLIAAGGLLLLRFGRLDARERCWMGIGFLMLAVMLPALDPRLAPSFTPPALPEAVSYAVAPDLPAAAPLPVVTPAAVDIAPAPSASPTPPHVSGQVTLAPLIGLGLLWAFLAALVVGVVRLAVGLLAAARLARLSRPIELPVAVLAPMRRLATAHGRKAIPVRASNRLTVPAVVGGLSPMILVPADFERHGEEAMTAALLHECAHVVRGDYAINLACEMLTVPLIWHPAIHLIKSQVQADRETACDRLAASQMPAKRYASCLVALADAMSPAPRTALAMQTLFGRGELERRVKTLLQTPIGEMRGRLLRAALVGAPVLGAVIASGMIFHVEPAMAQAAQQVVAPPATVAAAPLPPVPPTPPAAATPATPATQASADKPKTRRIVERQVRRWTSEDGKTHTIVTESDRDLTPAERARVEADVAKASEEAAKASAYVRSPEFRAKIDEASRAAHSAAVAQAEAAQAEAMVHSQEVRAQISEMVARQRTMIAMNRSELAAQMRRVKEILNDPEVKKALDQARTSGPEVRRALDRLDRELDRSLDRVPAPPRPPQPPAPPAPPPEPEAP